MPERYDFIAGAGGRYESAGLCAVVYLKPCGRWGLIQDGRYVGKWGNPQEAMDVAAANYEEE